MAKNPILKDEEDKEFIVRYNDTFFGKTKRLSIPIIITMIVSTLATLGIDVKELIKPQFTPEEKVLILESAKYQKEIYFDQKVQLKDYIDSNITYREISDHMKNKSGNHISINQYESSMAQINRQLFSIKTTQDEILVKINFDARIKQEGRE